MIKAIDNGQPAKYSFARVQITLTPGQKPLLFFPLQLYLGRIFENEPTLPTSSPILTVKALPLPGAETNGAKQYFLLQTDDDTINFRIDAMTGDLYAMKQFDYEAKSSYTFGVGVMDRNNRTTSSQVQVLIKGSSFFTSNFLEKNRNRFFGSGSTRKMKLNEAFIGRDEFAPDFDHQSYSFTVTKDAQVGQILGAVYARDKDSGRDGQVNFIKSIKINLNKNG